MSIHSVRFALLVLVTGVLFVRPTELIESLRDAPVYEVTILCALALSGSVLREQLTVRSLKTNPVTACVVGLLVAVGLSHLSHFAVRDALDGMIEFVKVLLSYLLLVGVLNTLGRLRLFLAWLLVFILGLTTLALLHHYEVIDNPALRAVEEVVVDKESGAQGLDVRMSGAGIFGNPNDLSRILAVSIVLCLYFCDGGAPRIFRPLWLALIGVFGHALLLTMSRGGLIALAVSLLTLSAVRFGVVRTAILGALALPIFAVAVGGRQTDISTSEGTGQQRIQLWSDGLDAMKSFPVFGSGMNTYQQFTSGRLVAHNSFVHAYVELGLFGGTLFFVAMWVALWRGFRLAREGERTSHPGLQRVGCYVFAILAGYVAGMMSSSRCYMIPTYILLGLVVVYLRLARAELRLPSLRVDARFVARLAVLSGLFFITLKVYVMSAAQFGGAQ